MTRLGLLGALLLAACDTGGGGGTMADAPKMIDATTNKVLPVTCPATVAATVMTTSTVDAYMPMATTGVPVNGIVKFVMASAHNVQPNTIGTSDPGLVVNFGETKCLQFTAAGTFGFFCGPHGFAGTVMVQ